MLALLARLVRRFRRRVADDTIDELIAAKRARPRPGMESIDQALRDRSARRRRERDKALEAVRREFDNPRPKLHRVG